MVGPQMMNIGQQSNIVAVDMKVQVFDWQEMDDEKPPNAYHQPIPPIPWFNNEGKAIRGPSLIPVRCMESIARVKKMVNKIIGNKS